MRIGNVPMLRRNWNLRIGKVQSRILFGLLLRGFPRRRSRKMAQTTIDATVSC
jgi:hypothetical protein